MGWLENLIFNEGIAHTVLIYAFVIFAGVMLGKVKIFNISLGATFILFVGILVGHFNITIEHNTLEFVKEFGLILFIYSIGLQVGPGFFSSFKKGGLVLNLLAIGTVVLGVTTTIAMFYILQGRVSMPNLVGIMSGAVTNTPGLGAAQEALKQVYENGRITEIPQIALGYAVTYPLGVVGIILSIITIRFIFKINIDKEAAKSDESSADSSDKPESFSIIVTNSSVDGKNIEEIKVLANRNFVFSRLQHGEKFSIPNVETVIHQGDLVLIIASSADKEAIVAFLGKEKENVNWKLSESQMVSRQIVITKEAINGKTLKQLRLRTQYGVNVTRILRAGIELLADKDIALQIGDKITIVGELDEIMKVERFMGNTVKRLDHPNLIALFFGIFIGVLFGSIPFFIPGIPMPVKLGLAGGPLIIAILIGRFGYRMRLVTYTTNSANLMIREIGISLFLASVGLASGPKFVETVISNDGLLWVGLGFLITIIPMLTIGIIGRKVFKINYLTLGGMLAGSSTDPPALAYTNSLSDSTLPAVGYSTVYPLTMFMRVIFAQLLILLFV